MKLQDKLEKIQEQTSSLLKQIQSLTSSECIELSTEAHDAYIGDHMSGVDEVDLYADVDCWLSHLTMINIGMCNLLQYMEDKRVAFELTGNKEAMLSISSVHLVDKH